MDEQFVFNQKFVFGSETSSKPGIQVADDVLYTEELRYGFMTEVNTSQNEHFSIPELNSGFYVKPHLKEQQLTNIITEESYCYSDQSNVPLVFKIKVPKSGNYQVTLVMQGLSSTSQVTIFAERRRCVLLNQVLKQDEPFEYHFMTNLCEVIPRGKQEIYQDQMLDISIIGSKVAIREIQVVAVTDIPTIYLAGDSTVTDQQAEYPYFPARSYCGWGQMFPLLFKPEIAVSNHAHSGLTTESFKPHWEIVKRHIKVGDWFFIQFGHNDQKRDSLAPFDGYYNNLRNYVEQVRTKGAYPVIVSPVSRSLWHEDGTFNDLLQEYASACRQLAKEIKVPLVDLHARSVDFIKKWGARDSLRFFYPNDYTHFNDFGGVAMVKLIYQELLDLSLEPLNQFLRVLTDEQLQIDLPE